MTTILRLPGLIDAHVHLREPGGTQKEDLASGSAAALAGGFTAVLDMPNNTPPIIDAASLVAKREGAASRLHCDVGFFLGASADAPLPEAALAAASAGLKVYLDVTFGPLRVNELGPLQAYMAAWPRHKPIVFHAEGASVAVAVGLCTLFRRPVHLAHVSRRDEVALIRRAKEAGLPVTCEVTPHHLFLTEEDAAVLGPLGMMRPPLGAEADVAALWQNLDLIDIIATDHAPHTLAEKAGAKPPPGVPGLETALPLMLTAVAAGRLTLERMVEMMYETPRRLFGLPVQPETWVEVDTAARWTLGSDGLFTKCGWTPFAGRSVQGRVVSVTLRGREVLRHGRPTAPPQGHVLFAP